MSISEEMKARLSQFATHANRSLLHPLDWERFFEVVFHGQREGATDITEFRVALRQAGDENFLDRAGGFSDEMLDRLVTFYEKGVEMLDYLGENHGEYA